MAPVLSSAEHLNRLFTGLAENTFQVELGVADPPLVDYVADLLVRFVRMDSVFRIRDVAGRRLEEVAEMMVEAEQRDAHPKREIHRHIGDFTLFWTGVYPEALRRMCSATSKDHLIDYCEQGKRSYRIASTFDSDPYAEESEVLRKLSEHFELFSIGLNRVRKNWEELAAQAGNVERN